MAEQTHISLTDAQKDKCRRNRKQIFGKENVSGYIKTLIEQAPEIK